MKRSFLPLRLKITLWSIAVFCGIHVLVSASWIALQRPMALALGCRSLRVFLFLSTTFRSCFVLLAIGASTRMAGGGLTYST